MRLSTDIGLRLEPGDAIAERMPASESARSAGARYQMPTSTIAHTAVAAVAQTPAHTRCMSSNSRPNVAGHD